MINGKHQCGVLDRLATPHISFDPGADKCTRFCFRVPQIWFRRDNPAKSPPTTTSISRAHSFQEWSNMEPGTNARLGPEAHRRERRKVFMVKEFLLDFDFMINWRCRESPLDFFLICTPIYKITFKIKVSSHLHKVDIGISYFFILCTITTPRCWRYFVPNYVLSLFRFCLKQLPHFPLKSLNIV